MVMLEIKICLPASLRRQTAYNKLSIKAPDVPLLNDLTFPLVPVKYCKQPPGALESVKKQKYLDPLYPSSINCWFIKPLSPLHSGLRIEW
jgi:hypothetical protein